MSTFSRIRTWYRHSLTPALALQSFTALFGIRPHHHQPLAELLARLDGAQNSAYGAIPGLHHLRWILFAPTEKKNVSAPDAPRALLLSVAFDGDLDDMLEELLLGVKDEMLEVLRHCEGYYAESFEPAAFMKRRRVRSDFAFRDIGALTPDHQSATVADASLSELRSAARVMDRFAEFYAKHPPVQFEADAQALRKKFLEKLEVPDAAGPLHPLETRQEEEERYVRIASELMQRKQRRVTRRMNDGAVRRAAHAKAHGLLHATFKVSEPESPHELEYRAGLFGKIGATFDAVVRPSNATENVSADRQFDARGLAISLDLSGYGGRCLGRPDRQDFVLMDHPVFVVPNVRRLVELMAVLEMQDRRRRLWYGLRHVLAPGGPKEVSIIARCLLSRPRHPFLRTFHSAVPYQLGPAHITKYSVQASSSARIEPARDTTSDDFLSTTLESSLEQGVTLDFFLHVLRTSGDQPLLRRAVEDGMLDWNRIGATKVKVATLEIGRQPEGVAARRQRAEAWSFSPWNALAEHRPLGSLNRARRVAYRDSAAARGATSTPEPRIPQNPEQSPDRDAAE